VHTDQVSYREKAGQVTSRTAVELGVVGLGAALAGPLGALGAAALAAGIKPAIELLAVRETQGLRNIQHLMDALTQTTGIPLEDLASWAKSNEGRFALVTHAFQSAYSTLNTEKVRALAAVLRENIDDDAKLDLASLIVTALTDLEAPHIRVLHAMLDGPRCPREAEDQYPPGVWGLFGLRLRFPGLASGLSSIMATLERQAMVDGRGADGTDPWTGEVDPVWRVAEFGRLCHGYLMKTDEQ